MSDCIYFGRFSHCTGLYCQGAKNSADKQSSNGSLLGWQGSTKSRLAPPGSPCENNIYLHPISGAPPAVSLGWVPASPHMAWVSLPTDRLLTLVSAAHVKPTGFRWPTALNMLFIVANSCFHNASCLSWSLHHPKKGIMKYMAFIWVAVLFVIFHLGDAYWRRHVKLQRVFFFSLKDKPPAY